MTWNHRVIRHYDENDIAGADVWFGIHECFYENPRDEIPTSWTEEAIAPIGDTSQELLWAMRNMIEATSKPILEIDGDKLRVWKEKE